MQIHQLRYVCAVAKLGSFTRAAQHERLAQPSLSQQVRKLEEEIGGRLFDRLARSVRLTQLGEAFLPRAEAILQQVADAKLEVQEMAGAERGKLVIGAIPTIAPYFLPPCLASFARKFPRVQIIMMEDVTSALLNLVQEGGVDLALLALPVPTTRCLTRELFRERLYVVVPQSHRLARLPQVHLAQIENDPFLLLKEGHCFRENTLSACGRARVQPNVVFESGQFTTILAMVAAGTGVSVVPEMAVEKRQGCRFLPLADEGAYRRIGIVQLKQHFRSRVHRAFLDHLRDGEEATPSTRNRVAS
ncbi:MAG: LysR family transcriptional regulator [Acidobacteria bacterium]|nr:MAG: LysR family transcriptional regulator [Acidobacteriota bacterium]